jgi:hypothetical protein
MNPGHFSIKYFVPKTEILKRCGMLPVMVDLIENAGRRDAMGSKYLLVLLPWAALHCSCDFVPILPYVPPVTFTGFFNEDYDSLAGNRAWPNRCELEGDTVRIFCYSTTFSENNRIRNGNFLRLDLYPDSADGFRKRNILFHCARYFERNESYTINRGDTADVTKQFESVVIDFSRTDGSAIELEDIYIAAGPLAQGRYLQITDGRLFGSIR